MASYILIILAYIVLYKVVTSIGFFPCRKVETPFGRAVDITLQVGVIPIQNSVNGKIVCNGESAGSAQLRPLPSMYCPNSIVGNLNAVERLIDETCRRSLPSQSPAVITESISAGLLRRRRVLRESEVATQPRFGNRLH